MADLSWLNETDIDEFYFNKLCSIYAPRMDMVCKYCGREDLKWAMHNGKWHLFDINGAIHCCAARSKPTRRKLVGLFNRKPIYVSDRGEEFQLEEMEPSHLLNVIKHHRAQINTVDWVMDQLDKDKTDFTNLHYRRINLYNTIEALLQELATRDPKNDHEE